MTLDKETIKGIVEKIVSETGLLDKFREDPATTIREALPEGVNVSTEEMEDLVGQVWKAAEKLGVGIDGVAIPPIGGVVNPTGGSTDGTGNPLVP